MEATSLELGNFLGDSPLVGLNQIDNETGILRLAVARVGETKVPSRPGVLATVTFTVSGTAKSAGGIRAKASGQEISSPVRITTVLEQREGRWLVIQSYDSLPAAGQKEGESWPTG